MSEFERKVRIVNELGLHARAASKLVQLAAKFSVEIKVGHDELMVNAKSIMGVLMLAASKGTDLLLIAIGEQDEAKAALDALSALIADRFGEGK